MIIEFIDRLLGRPPCLCPLTFIEFMVGMRCPRHVDAVAERLRGAPVEKVSGATLNADVRANLIETGQEPRQPSGTDEDA